MAEENTHEFFRGHQQQANTHHIVIPGFVDRPYWNDCTAGQMDRKVGWWTTSGKIGLPSLARVMGVDRQEQLIEFVFYSIYVDLKYNEISLTFTAGFVWCVY